MSQQTICFTRLIALFALALFGQLLMAAEVTLKTPHGLSVSADYRKGTTAKPAILLLHGYLQTRNFPLIYNLANALSSNGFTTLAPTLSLGISNRMQSLACEAIHTHALNNDVEELSLWISWLVEQGHKEVVLVGHSFAAIQFLAYFQKQPAPEIKKLIYISISDMEHKFFSRGRVDKSAALKLAARDPVAIGNFELGFCKHYRSGARAYLSYVEWTQERVLQALPKIKISSAALFGQNDTVVSKQWASQVKKSGIPVSTVADANHFFDDSSSEFELQGQIESLLEQM